MPRIDEGLKTYTNSTEYLKNGVSINPAIPAIGDKAKIEYTGLLVQEGATHIYVRLGYGEQWDNPYDYQMIRTDKGFEANIPILKGEQLNICFKDCANNWDNNSGDNYAFDVISN